MRIIIIEGRDRIGKSSLIRHIAENLDNVIVAKSLNAKNLLRNIHEVRRRPNFFETRHIGILEQVKDQLYTMSRYPEHFDKMTYIFDRLHWTGYVYAKVLRPDSLAKVFSFDENMIEYNQVFEQELLSFNPNVQLFTFCTPDDAITEQDDFVKDPQDLIKINIEYRNIHQFSKIPNKHLIELGFDYNARYTDMSERYDSILEMIKSH